MAIAESIAHYRMTGNHDMEQEWEQKMRTIERRFLPGGSGFDEIPSVAMATKDRIIIYGAFHAMNEYGMYDGWINFSVTVKPVASLKGFGGINVIVRHSRGRWPRRHRDLKEYIAECYAEALCEEIDLADL